MGAERSKGVSSKDACRRAMEGSLKGKRQGGTAFEGDVPMRSICFREVTAWWSARVSICVPALLVTCMASWLVDTIAGCCKTQSGGSMTPSLNSYIRQPAICHQAPCSSIRLWIDSGIRCGGLAPYEHWNVTVWNANCSDSPCLIEYLLKG